MNNKIYRLAHYYIKRCNNKWKNNQYPNKEILKSLTRLTYWAFDKYLLLYGDDAEWQIFNKYDVLNNAIQRLAEYENIGTVEEFKALKKEAFKYEVKYEDENLERILNLSKKILGIKSPSKGDHILQHSKGE